MKRITKEIKAIADKHLEARISGKFDDPSVDTKSEVINALRSGKTFSAVMDQIEIRFISITSLIMQKHLNHISESYKRSIYKGFNILLSE